MTTRGTTQAAVLREIGEPVEVVELTLPELKPGQVLVDVAFSGVCHTQLSEVRGRRGPDRFLPHTLGHEGSGVVAKVGEGVSKVRRGDHVVLSWLKGVGADIPSTTYTDELGPVNSGAISTLMRRTIVSENRLIQLPFGFPLRDGAMLGCAFPTGAGIVLKTAGLRRDDSVVVLGAGGVGLSAIMAAHMVGASPIVAVDVNDYKLKMARDFGATHTVYASAGDIAAQVVEVVGGKRLDCAIEAAGRQETAEAALQCVRDDGGLAVLAGNMPVGEKIMIDPWSLIRGRRLVGTWGGETDPDRDIPVYVEHQIAGRLDLSRLITHEFALADINLALEELEGGRVGRAVVTMQ